jgi:hypothetical protein
LEKFLHQERGLRNLKTFKVVKHGQWTGKFEARKYGRPDMAKILKQRNETGRTLKIVKS